MRSLERSAGGRGRGRRRAGTRRSPPSFGGDDEADVERRLRLRQLVPNARGAKRVFLGGAAAGAERENLAGRRSAVRRRGSTAARSPGRKRSANVTGLPVRPIASAIAARARGLWPRNMSCAARGTTKLSAGDWLDGQDDERLRVRARAREELAVGRRFELIQGTRPATIVHPGASGIEPKLRSTFLRSASPMLALHSRAPMKATVAVARTIATAAVCPTAQPSRASPPTTTAKMAVPPCFISLRSFAAPRARARPSAPKSARRRRHAPGRSPALGCSPATHRRSARPTPPA